MRRGEIRYAETQTPPGRRPVLIVTATDLVPALSRVVCAPITTKIRGIETRLPLGNSEGLRESSEAACDGLIALEKSVIDTVPLGTLDVSRFGELDRAVARALGIRRENLPLR